MRAIRTVMAVAALAAVAVRTGVAALPAAPSPLHLTAPATGTSSAGAPMSLGMQILPSTAAGLLGLAESGVEAARRYWWNPTLGWYDEQLARTWDPSKPLARLWDAYPLFEALDAVAIASPTPAHLAAVRAFADKAEQYYDPNLEPVGGYTWYIDTESPNEHAYFDDNGWWELGFLDAYRATGSSRYLVDAERAFRFIAIAGWAPDGGVWWDTDHLKVTAEPLAAEIYGGLALYEFTRNTSYLATAEQFLDWANASSWNRRLQLYARNSTDPTVLDYVEGMMIGAHLELCQITGEQSYCRQAERLAAASVEHFGAEVSWTPAADAIYLRFLLDLYEQDGNPRWYQVVYENAERAFEEARAPNGLFLGRWNGTQFAAALLQVHAATTSLFAWLAAATAPAGVSSLPVRPVADVALPISVTPTLLSFAASELGQSHERALTVADTSSVPVTVSGTALGPLTRSDTEATFATTDACPAAPLLPGQSCRIEVTFTPSSPQPAEIALAVETTTAAGTSPPVQVTLEGSTARPAGTEVAAPLARGPWRRSSGSIAPAGSWRHRLLAEPAVAPPALWVTAPWIGRPERLQPAAPHSTADAAFAPA